MNPRAPKFAALALTLGCSAAPVAPEREVAATPEPERCAATPRAEVGVAREASSLAREPIMRAFRRDRPRHTCCYEAHLTRHPAASGRATVRVVFDGPGAVDAGVTRSSPELERDAPFTACLVETARRMRVPEWAREPAPALDERAERQGPGETAPGAPSEPSRPQTIRISYPISFTTTMASN